MTKTKFSVNAKYPALWIKLIHYITILTAIILASSYAMIPIDSDDLFMHIKTGELIWKNKKILDKDPFSYTQQGRKWINHEWLSALVFYLIYKFYNFNGLIYFQVLVVAIIFASIYFFSAKKLKYNLLAPLIIAFSSYSISDRYTIRPHLFNFFFIAFTLILLFKFKESKKFKYIIWLLIIFILWINFHSGAFVGVLILWIFLLVQLLKKDKLLSIKKTLLIALISILVLAINPYNFHIFDNFIKIFSYKIYQQRVYEWKTILYFKNYPMLYAFLICNLLYLLIIILTFKGKYLINHIIFLLFSILTFKSIRFIGVFGVSWAFLSLYSIGGKIKDKTYFLRRKWFKWHFFILLILIALFIRTKNKGYYINPVKRQLGRGLLKNRYPINAFKFLDKANIKGNMFNDYNLGSLIIFFCYPKRKVFIDGRNHIYPEEFTKEYYSVNRSPIFLERVANKYKINYFILENKVPIYRRVAGIWDFLSQSPEWKLVYWDDLVLIYLRNSPENQEIIRKYECKYYDPVYPENFTIAYYSKEEPEKVKEELKRLLRLNPECVRCKYLLQKYIYRVKN